MAVDDDPVALFEKGQKEVVLLHLEYTIGCQFCADFLNTIGSLENYITFSSALALVSYTFPSFPSFPSFLTYLLSAGPGPRLSKVLSFATCTAPVVELLNIATSPVIPDFSRASLSLR
jgi:hypothetical protein